jgi:hypothetical protein
MRAARACMNKARITRTEAHNWHTKAALPLGERDFG